MAIKNGAFKVKNISTGEIDEVMLKTTLAQVDGLDKLTGATANAAGVWGLAPAPTKGSQNLPLCGDARYKVLPIEGGGTGANTVAAAVQALLGSSAVGSSTKSIYYDGETLKACADSIGGGGIVAALLEQNGYVKFANGLILQWGLASTSAGWAIENKYPIAFKIATLAITITPRSPSENSNYCEVVGIRLCTKTGFYGGLQVTGGTNNLFYIAVGI